jgi:hypothetical protein
MFHLPCAASKMVKSIFAISRKTVFGDLPPDPGRPAATFVRRTSPAAGRFEFERLNPRQHPFCFRSGSENYRLLQLPGNLGVRLAAPCQGLSETITGLPLRHSTVGNSRDAETRTTFPDVLLFACRILPESANAVFFFLVPAMFGRPAMSLADPPCPPVLDQSTHFQYRRCGAARPLAYSPDSSTAVFSSCRRAA